MPEIQTEVKDDVLRITINRPEKKNALSQAMYTALAEAVERGDANPDVRVMVLHGNGDSFTAGNDLQDFMANPWTGKDVPPAVRFMFAVARATKPVIAAVHGSAVGIGVTILLHCDLVYAAEDAKLVMPFVNLGIVPEAGSTVLDNSCLMFISNLWSGTQHDSTKVPLLLLGGLGGKLSTGRVLDYRERGDENRKLCSLYLSLMNRLGVKAERFGDSSAPLSEL